MEKFFNNILRWNFIVVVGGVIFVIIVYVFYFIFFGKKREIDLSEFFEEKVNVWVYFRNDG